MQLKPYGGYTFCPHITPESEGFNVIKKFICCESCAVEIMVGEQEQQTKTKG